MCDLFMMDDLSVIWRDFDLQSFLKMVDFSMLGLLGKQK